MQARGVGLQPLSECVQPLRGIGLQPLRRGGLQSLRGREALCVRPGR